MFVQTDLASEGDKVILRSPAITLPDVDNKCVHFKVHSYAALYGTLAQIEVVVVPLNQLEYRNVSLRVIDLKASHIKWTEYYAKLPRRGEYVKQILLQGTILDKSRQIILLS